VLSAFDSFCRGAEQGRFPRLNDRHDLWQLLVLLTARKACDLVQHERRAKRGGGTVQGESAFDGPDSEPGIDQVAGHEPTPAFAAQLAEEYQVLLDRLPSAELRAVAVWKMEGYTNAEIAAQLGCVVRTVDRKLDLIRSLWRKEGAP
jgi:DNA-directed RNA polymerase specialized sigma24 family protein